MKKIWKKIIAVALTVCVCAPLTACGPAGSGGGGNNDNTPYVSLTIDMNQGAVQYGWTTKVIKRFEQAVANKPYANGKVGVKITDWNPESTDSIVSTAETSAYHIFLDEGDKQFSKRISSGGYLDITDVVTEPNPFDNGKIIRDKLDDEFKDSDLNCYNGKYYALPWKEFYNAMPYNVTLFEEYGFYFANPAESQIAFEGNGSYPGSKYYFIADNRMASKSVGLDGVAGTVDDGLPTTLEEFIALCYFVKARGNGLFPFGCTGGNHTDYTNYLLKTIIYGLSGPDGIEVWNTFDGEIEIVDYDAQGNGKYTSEVLWGLDGTYVPVTKKVTISPNDPESWNLIPRSSARYYATAFAKLMVENEWISDSVRSSTTNNIVSQEHFIFSGTSEGTAKMGCVMLMEGSYWYSEAEYNGAFGKYDLTMEDVRPEFAVLPYVRGLNGTVTAEGSMLIRYNSACNAWINGNLMKNQEKNQHIIDAAKDFLRFWYSDQEMLNYTEEVGQIRGGIKNAYWEEVVYAKDSNGEYLNGLNGKARVIKDGCKLPNYQISLLEMKRDGFVIAQKGDPVRNPSNLYRLGNSSGLLMSAGLGVIYDAFYRYHESVHNVFELHQPKVYLG